jgi:hypothetical protein
MIIIVESRKKPVDSGLNPVGVITYDNYNFNGSTIHDLSSIHVNDLPGDIRCVFTC